MNQDEGRQAEEDEESHAVRDESQHDAGAESRVPSQPLYSNGHADAGGRRRDAAP